MCCAAAVAALKRQFGIALLQQILHHSLGKHSPATLWLCKATCPAFASAVLRRSATAVPVRAADLVMSLLRVRLSNIEQRYDKVDVVALANSLHTPCAVEAEIIHTVLCISMGTASACRERHHAELDDICKCDAHPMLQSLPHSCKPHLKIIFGDKSRNVGCLLDVLIPLSGCVYHVCHTALHDEFAHSNTH